MKKFLLTTTLLTACGLSAFAQSKFTIGNLSSNPIKLLLPGAVDAVPVVQATHGLYNIALWLGPAGAQDSDLVKSSVDKPIGAAGFSPGQFSFGSITINEWAPNTDIKAQIRGWQAADPTIKGESASKPFKTTGSSSLVLIGTAGNKLNAFTIIVPEPTSMMLAGLGLSGLLFLRRDRKSVV